jgi:hypothetical protein
LADQKWITTALAYLKRARCHPDEEKRVVRLEGACERRQNSCPKGCPKEERPERNLKAAAGCGPGGGTMNPAVRRLADNLKVDPDDLFTVPALIFSPGVSVCLVGFLPLGPNSLGLCFVPFMPSDRVHL